LAEFREAAAEALALEDLEILSSGSGVDETRPVQAIALDPSGFFHLLGNVSEMVVTPDVSSGVSHIGGNLRTLRGQIREMNPVPVETGERNRMVGFRFVVEGGAIPSSMPQDPEI
jgi:hypothetical protein